MIVLILLLGVILPAYGYHDESIGVLVMVHKPTSAKDLAMRYYGDSDFWPLIYNEPVLTSPDDVVLASRIVRLDSMPVLYWHPELYQKDSSLVSLQNLIKKNRNFLSSNPEKASELLFRLLDVPSIFTYRFAEEPLCLAASPIDESPAIDFKGARLMVHLDMESLFSSTIVSIKPTWTGGDATDELICIHDMNKNWKYPESLFD